jgi:hypothetical protein
MGAWVRRNGMWLPLAGIAVAAILLAALSVYARRIGIAGFYYDDWANAAAQRFDATGFAERYRVYRQDAGARPLSALWGTVIWRYGHPHPGWMTFGAVAFALVTAGVLAAALRRVGTTWWIACLVAVLWFVSPMASSTRLWISASTGNGVTLLALASIWCLATAYRAQARGARLMWHGAASACVVATMLWAEIAVLLLLAQPLLLHRLAPRRVLALRWLVDLVTVVPIAAYVVAGNRIPSTGTLGDQLDHGWEIFVRALEGFGTAFAPTATGPTAWWIAEVAVLVVAAGVAEARAGGIDGERVRRLVLMAGAGFVVVIASYAVYVPAESAYLPLRRGVHDRINVLSSIGYAMVVVGVLALAAELALRRHAPAVRDAAAILATCTVLVNSVVELDQRVDAYRRAEVAQRGVLAVVRETIPDPVDGSTTYVYNHVEWIDDVPVFAGQWDLAGAIRIDRDAPTLRAWILGPWTDTRLRCNDASVNPTGTFFVNRDRYDFEAKYGMAYLVDVTRRTGATLSDATVCEQAAGQVREFYEGGGFPPA